MLGPELGARAMRTWFRSEEGSLKNETLSYLVGRGIGARERSGAQPHQVSQDLDNHAEVVLTAIATLALK